MKQCPHGNVIDKRNGLSCLHCDEAREIGQLISIWSTRPAPRSPEGVAWEAGARQGWAWANSRNAKNDL